MSLHMLRQKHISVGLRHQPTHRKGYSPVSLGGMRAAWPRSTSNFSHASRFRPRMEGGKSLVGYLAAAQVSDDSMWTRAVGTSDANARSHPWMHVPSTPQLPVAMKLALSEFGGM